MLWGAVARQVAPRLTYSTAAQPQVGRPAVTHQYTAQRRKWHVCELNKIIQIVPLRFLEQLVVFKRVSPPPNITVDFTVKDKDECVLCNFKKSYKVLLGLIQ